MLLFITMAADGDNTDDCYYYPNYYLSLISLALADGERVKGIELYFNISSSWYFIYSSANYSGSYYCTNVGLATTAPDDFIILLLLRGSESVGILYFLAMVS